VRFDQSSTLGHVHHANVHYTARVGVFTRLADHEVAGLAAAYDIGDVVELTPIEAGTINSNFRLVTTQRGHRRQWFLRVNEGKSEDDVAYEAMLVDAFAAAGLPTPTPLRAGERSYAPLGDKWVSLFPWRAGSHLAEVTEATANRLGVALAQLHIVGLELPRRASIYDQAHLIARFARFESSTDPQLAHAISIIRDELGRATGAAGARAAATHGVIHGDLFRDNVLWEGEEISAILDFEQASGGSLAYDLAVCINDWCWTGEVRLDLAAALLTGYQAVRPLTVDDRAALLIEVRAAATRFTITRITDVYLAEVENPEKDFRAFLARVEAWRGQALGGLSALL
jgi:homoserine kinase type II